LAAGQATTKVPLEVIVPPDNPLPVATEVTVPVAAVDWVDESLNVMFVPLTVIGMITPYLL
jgi:hypothetical protein